MTSMPIANSVIDHTHKVDGTITLDETARHRRRIKLVSDNEITFLLDLPQARLLRHGDGLVLDDGRIIQVRAEPEELMEIRGCDKRHLLSLAWQIGNRHLAAQIEPDRILVRHDHVIRQMLEGLGAEIKDVTEPFDPEGGAYGDAHHTHGHHGHSHD